jgi:mannosyltransferase OCH1-like enzyme
MIPKLIHQTAKTADIPPQWRRFQDRVKTLHPTWTYHFWTDEENHAFVQREFPDLLDLFVRLPKNIMRADVVRYLFIYRLGGIYLDLDYEMLKPFDLLDYDLVLPWESSGEFGVGNDKISNSFFASAPCHPFWRMVIDDLKADPPLMANPDVEKETGPEFLTGIFRKAVASGMQIYSPPRDWFNPRTPRSPQAYRAIIRKNVSYGIHHCHSTWREWGLARRMKSKAGNVFHWLFDRR